MAKKISGTVIKKSGPMTISVLIKRIVKHPIYQKQFTRSKKFLVHDPQEQAVVGDVVTIVPCRPISKSKSYILESAKLEGSSK